jgi:hypothetical protein
MVGIQFDEQDEELVIAAVDGQAADVNAVGRHDLQLRWLEIPGVDRALVVLVPAPHFLHVWAKRRFVHAETEVDVGVCGWPQRDVSHWLDPPGVEPVLGRAAVVGRSPQRVRSHSRSGR